MSWFDHVRIVCLKVLQGLHAIDGNLDLVALSLQVLGHTHRGQLLVIDDENPAIV